MSSTNIIHLPPEILAFIVSFIDAIPAAFFFGTCKTLWNLLLQDAIFQSRVEPYKPLIKSKEWHFGLHLAIANFNMPQTKFFAERSKMIVHGLIKSIHFRFFPATQYFMEQCKCLLQLQNDSTLTLALCSAISLGETNIVHYIIKEAGNFASYPKAWEHGVFSSVLSGNLHLAKLCAEQAAKNGVEVEWDEALYRAALGGDMATVHWCIDNSRSSAIDFNRGLRAAATKGNMKLIHFCINNGANDWNLGLVASAMEGRVDIFEFFVEKGASDWNGALFHACLKDQRHVVEMLVEKGADRTYGLEGAAEGGYPDLVEFFVQRFPNQQLAWNYAMVRATQSGKKEVIERCIERGANSWNRALFAARMASIPYLCTLYEEKGGSKDSSDCRGWSTQEFVAAQV